MSNSQINYYWVLSCRNVQAKNSLFYNTFKFLYERLDPYLQRKYTRMKEAISIESRVVMSLQRFRIGNNVSIVGEVYGVQRIFFHFLLGGEMAIIMVFYIAVSAM